MVLAHDCRHQVSYKLETILNKVLVRSGPGIEDDYGGVDMKMGGEFQEKGDESESQQVLLSKAHSKEDPSKEHDLHFSLSNNLLLDNNNEASRASMNREKKFPVNESKARDTDYDWIQREKEIENHTSLADIYYVSDLFSGGDLIAKLTPADNLVLKVNLSGVRMVKVIPRTPSSFNYHDRHQMLPHLFRPNAFQ